ncbi:hypothetical protein CMK22_19830 [Candidatus Poribacteria bacterium]|nr:hypothetical protein [Candidatus Poribacteria bacterium]
MKLVVISYSHHGRSIGRIGYSLGHEIIGVMDTDEDARTQLEKEFGCPGFDTVGTCLDTVSPDAALITGKHIKIPSHIQACVDRRIPYLVDKPFADCAARLRPVAEASEKHGVFSTLTLPNRASKIVAIIKKMFADGSLGKLVLYNSRLNNGSPTRYDPTPSAWHNIPAISGGGSWATEGAHGIDTYLQFVGENQITVVGAIMSNSMYGRKIEDSAVGMLRSDDGVTGIIESGYTFPSEGGRSGDHFFRFIGSKASVFAFYGKKGEPLIEINTSTGTEFEEDLGHGERMRNVINEGLCAIQEGKVPETNILDAVRVLEIQDAVYDHARLNPLTNGPYPMGAATARP